MGVAQVEILNLGDGSEESWEESYAPKRSKSSKAVIGISGLAALTGLGSTLAANISINSGPVEFGQGVAQTVTCDADGFNVKPVAYFDNATNGFRLDYVEVSGLNLIPVGSDTSLYDPSTKTYGQYDGSAAIAAHPGQYFDDADSQWKNTCDGIVLDFKAYTDDPTYSINTVDGYDYYANNPSGPAPTDTASPMYWTILDTSPQWDGSKYIYDTSGGILNTSIEARNADVAIVFDSTDSNYSSNYGTQDLLGDFNWFDSTYYISSTSPDDAGGTGFVAESSYQFFTKNGHHRAELYSGIQNEDEDPALGISKITVESMKYFPAGYRHWNTSPGIAPSP